MAQLMAAASGFDVAVTPPALAQALIAPGHPHEMIAVPGVLLAPGEALVRVELATICPGDVRAADGRQSSPVPTILGHEGVGRVIQVGDDSLRTLDGAALRIGDRVVWGEVIACGDCDRCHGGRAHLCRHVRRYGAERVAPRWELSGAFATHLHVARRTALVRVPEHVSATALAPAACGAPAAWQALEAACSVVDLAGALVLVSGGGLVGLSTAAMATARGARVLVADPDPARRALALRFGALATIDPCERRSLGAALRGQGAVDVDVVIEASGNRSSVIAALDVIGTGGAVILAGGSRPQIDEITLDSTAIAAAGVTVRGSGGLSTAALAAGVAFVVGNHARVPFAELVAETFPLERLDMAMRTAAMNGAPVRVAVRP